MSKVKPFSLYCGQFAFQEDYLTKYLICPICDMVMRNPMRLHACGHTYCDKCIMEPTCKICQIPYELKQPDLIAANLVADSYVKCLAKDCPFRGTYENYTSTHKNSCRLKHYNGIDSWLDKVKECLDDANAKPSVSKPPKKVTVNCQEIQLEDTVKPKDDYSVLIEEKSNINRTELQSLVVDNRANKKIDVESLYHVNPSNLGKVMEQIKEKEHPAPRRCQYGKYCKLMLEEGGCPYIHPQKDRRRQYQLEQWANIPVVRPSINSPKPLDDLEKFALQDTQRFLNDYFSPFKTTKKSKAQPAPPTRPNNNNKKTVIQL